MKAQPSISLAVLLFCLGTIVLSLNCAINGLGGNSSQTGNPLITGSLHNQDGSGAKNAVVTFVPANFDPRSGASSGLFIDSTITDDTGAYNFDSLPAGVYNVLGRGGSRLSYRRSFTVPGRMATVVPGDTLRDPGSIKGVVRLLPGDDSRTVFIIVMGTTVLTLPRDSTGNFELSGMAPGSYNVRLLSTLGYKPLETVFTIVSGRETVLGDTIRLISTGIPAIGGMKIVYDSLLQKVTLVWNMPAEGRGIAGYNIYRRLPDSNMALLKENVSDTMFVDSTVIQDLSYYYQVAAIDSQGTAGGKSPPQAVLIHSNLLAKTGEIVKGEGTAPGQFSQVTLGRVDTSGNIFVLDRGSSRLQELDSTGNFLHAIENLTTPIGFEIGPGKAFITLEGQSNKIRRYDSNGIEQTGWNTLNTPKSLLLVSDTLYVLTDNGIEMFDSGGGSWGRTALSLDFTGYNGGDLATDNSGNVYLGDGRYLYKFDKTGKSVARIFEIRDTYHNQNPRINCIGARYILVSTVGAASPFNSSHYLVDLSGVLIGRWYSAEAITDVAVKHSTTCLGFTSDGKIITFEINCPAP